MEGVRKFYTELLLIAIKYFKPSLQSLSLKYMDILNPVNILFYSLDKLQKRFEYLARKWSNIIAPEKVDYITL